MNSTMNPAAARRRLADLQQHARQLDEALDAAEQAGEDGPLTPLGAAQLLVDVDALADRLLTVTDRVATEFDPVALLIEE